MLKAMKDFKPEVIVILGDFADLYCISSFDKDPARKLNLEWEINEVNTVLDTLDNLKPKQKIFIAGNHEFRLDRFIKAKVPELYGTISTEKSFRLKERNWTFVPYRKDYKLGKLYLTHDTDGVARNAVYKVLDTYMHSAVTAHTHRIAYVVEADGVGEPILSATFGWLGDVEQIDYQHRIKAVKAYVLGFGIGYMELDTGLVFTQPIPIVNYKCMISGKIYKG